MDVPSAALLTLEGASSHIFQARRYFQNRNLDNFLFSCGSKSFQCCEESSHRGISGRIRTKLSPMKEGPTKNTSREKRIDKRAFLQALGVRVEVSWPDQDSSDATSCDIPYLP